MKNTEIYFEEIMRVQKELMKRISVLEEILKTDVIRSKEACRLFNCSSSKLRSLVKKYPEIRLKHGEYSIGKLNYILKN